MTSAFNFKLHCKKRNYVDSIDSRTTALLSDRNKQLQVGATIDCSNCTIDCSNCLLVVRNILCHDVKGKSVVKVF